MPSVRRPIAAATATTIPSTAPPVEHETNVELLTLRHRGRLALGGLILFGVTVMCAFFLAEIASDASWIRVSDLLKVIIPVETLFLGGVSGYYFGSKS